MVSGGYGKLVEIAPFQGFWGVTIFFDGSFTTYLVPVNEVVVSDEIDAKELQAKEKKKKNKEKGK